MMKVIAVDDEPLTLDIAEAFCKKLSFLQFEKGFTQARAALQYLQHHEADVLLLDINMPAMSGMAFYKQLTHKPMLIFTTSYSEYALESYDLGAVDYLLKPFSSARFEMAMQKAFEKYQLLNKAAAASVPQQYLMLKADYGLAKVVVNDILFVEALDNYLKIHLHNQQPAVVRMTLKSLHSQLPDQQFIQVHRSYIVPFSRINTIRNKTITIAGKNIPVGKSYESCFQAQLRQQQAFC